MAQNTSEDAVRVVDLGVIPYDEALERQRTLNERVAQGVEPATVLLLEHEPVVTLSQRRGVGAHLLASPGELARRGIAVAQTDRGGDITYHGPGQLVAYPIWRLGPLGLNLGRHMRLLERAVIEAVAGFGVTARRDPGATGVWVDEPGPSHEREPGVDQAVLPGAGVVPPRGPLPGAGAGAKLCAMGVRVRRNTTMHGLALNVTTRLADFETIVPCGLAGRGVTSLSRLLGAACPGMESVKASVADRLVALAQASAKSVGSVT